MTIRDSIITLGRTILPYKSVFCPAVSPSVQRKFFSLDEEVLMRLLDRLATPTQKKNDVLEKSKISTTNNPTTKMPPEKLCPR